MKFFLIALVLLSALLGIGLCSHEKVKGVTIRVIFVIENALYERWKEIFSANPDPVITFFYAGVFTLARQKLSEDLKDINFDLAFADSFIERTPAELGYSSKADDNKKLKKIKKYFNNNKEKFAKHDIVFLFISKPFNENAYSFALDHFENSETIPVIVAERDMLKTASVVLMETAIALVNGRNFEKNVCKLNFSSDDGESGLPTINDCVKEEAKKVKESTDHLGFFDPSPRQKGMDIVPYANIPLMASAELCRTYYGSALFKVVHTCDKVKFTFKGESVMLDKKAKFMSGTKFDIQPLASKRK